MFRIDPNSPPLRERAAVRASVDAKWEQGMEIPETWTQLTPPERVEWFLGELLVCLLDFRFHIWIQGFIDPGRLPEDCPRLLAALAEVGRPLDDEVAELLRWTAERAEGVRDGTGGEGVMSVVPLVWSAVWTGRVPEFAYALVERWPADLDPTAIEPGPWARTVVAPHEGEGPRYPECRVGYTGRAVGCALQAAPHASAIAETTAYALWRAGASNAELNRFFFDDSGAGRQLPEACARWVCFDGDGGDPERFDLLRRALDPLASLLGVEHTEGSLVVRAAADDLEGLQARLGEFCSARRAEPSAEGDLAASVRSLLRMDVDVILVDAADVSTEEHVEALFQSACVGVIVVLGGDAPLLDSLWARLAELDMRVETRR